MAISSDGNSGGLALLWKPETLVKVLMCSCCYIDALVDCENNGDKWRLTGFYGHPDTSRREETSVLLESLSQINQLPWLYIGDFNEIMKALEKESGNVRPFKQMDQLQSVINLCGFLDMGFYGAPFTWFKNKSEEGKLKTQLDIGALVTNG